MVKMTGSQTLPPQYEMPIPLETRLLQVSEVEPRSGRVSQARWVPSLLDYPQKHPLTDKATQKWSET